MNDALGDRMKDFEMAEAGRRLMSRLPVLARLDGKCFSSFTHTLKRPYDENLSNLMVDTTTFLVQETSALAGYTQSDEISLLWYYEDPKSQIFMDRRIQKMTSVLASMATAFFNVVVSGVRTTRQPFPQLVGKLAMFDCRVWNVPTKDEAANAFLWRELDATKNSVSMAAHSVCSHKELQGKHSVEMQEMLHQKGINWNDYPAFFKRGTFVLRRKTSRKFTTEELDELPPKHQARKNPDLVVERSDVGVVEMPPFSRVTNRVGVLFDGEQPTTKE